MAKALKYIIAALVLLVALALIVPSLIPADTYKDQIIAAVERSTGRVLTINGDLNLQFRPGVEFSIEDVTLSNAEGATDPLMAEMARMTIGVDWQALFSRKINITKFVLEEPVISLEVMKNGKANWEFSPATGEEVADGDEETDTVSESLDALSFGDLRIVNGRLVWRNHLAGQSYEVTGVNLILDLPDLKGPLEARGDLIYKGEHIKLDLALGSLEAITSGTETTFALAMASRLMKVVLDGALTGGSAAKIKARARVDVPSVRDLAAWTGASIASEKGFGPFAIEGDLVTAGQLYSFTNAKVAFDDMHGTGSLKVRNTVGKPVISGTLTVDRIDLRSYMTETQSTGEATDEKKELKWNSTPIDFSGLKALDVNFALKSKSLYFQDYEIGNVELSVSVRNNILTANLNKMDLYKGTGTGSLTFDVNNSAARVKTDFSFKGIDAGPLTQAATSRDLVEGTGELVFTLATTGRSQDELMRNLSGSGALSLRDGKLKGVNLNRMLQVISAFTPPRQTGEQASETTEQQDTQTAAETGSGKSTDFVEMGGTFKIAKGVLRTSDFALHSDAISLGGAGRVNIGKQTLNMKLTPGRRSDDGGTRLKIKAQGPWNDIQYGPDFEDIIKGGLRDILLGDTKEEDKEPVDAVIDTLLDSIFGPKKD